METDLNLRATELRLGLPGSDLDEMPPATAQRNNKRTIDAPDCNSNSDVTDDTQEAVPAAKSQVVGWPPIQSYRRNSFQQKKATDQTETGGIYVKVSRDGAPYLRKIDLKMYKGYSELLKALESMFKCFITGDFSVREGYNRSEYALTYEDKDGDWMLVGDVPWDMFITSCKRLRIMKGSEARGLGAGV